MYQARRLSGHKLSVLALLVIILNTAAAGTAPGVYRFATEPVLKTDSLAFAPWSDLMLRVEAEQALVAACLDDRKACPYYLKGYQHIVRRAQKVGQYGKLSLVNRFVNKRRWVSDDYRTKDESDDIWLSPVKFLRDGGDCEDFAVAKYFMLKDLGFDAEDLRIVVSSDHPAREPHAVLAVRLDDKVVLMETDDSIKRAREHHKYKFLYAVNEHHFWDHAGLVTGFVPESGARD